MRPLPVRVVQNPSDDFTELDGIDAPPPDLVVCFDPWNDEGILARMYGPRLPALRSEHKALLRVRPSDVQREAARLCHLWNDRLVHHTPLDDDLNPAPGRHHAPYTSLLDLRDEPVAELRRILDELADEGGDLLFETLLGGKEEETGHFREFLAEALAEENLRVRFDSGLFLPWPMLCLPRESEVSLPAHLTAPDELTPVFARFLGYRHQMDQTGGSHPRRLRRSVLPARPAVSLNHNESLDFQGRTRAAEVAQALAHDTTLVVRRLRDELFDALGRADLDEQFMYFWCHGTYQTQPPQPPLLSLELSDRKPIDARTVHSRRRLFGHARSPFRPFVLLNACNAAGPYDGADRGHLGRVLIEAGASGVLGPQISMPGVFGAEYALAYVQHYLDGRRTAGEITHALARHFADTYRNPLGLAYALHCGMDSRLERAPAAAADHGQEVTV
ncbi:CHAT domain-containing protein [Streptomyces sp. NPDC087440]|uniref:CHAT domain-containing protein n=1 Tax=Streptomyces sp. NPDC087440 TaxID=3365790 RepID=UPI0038012976